MKHLIKIESTAHGVLGVRHAGKDQQYCEAGEKVILKWQPDAGWGLKEAHFTTKKGIVTPIKDGTFDMPREQITIGGTFKKFALDDWTGDVVTAKYLILQEQESLRYYKVFIYKGSLNIEPL